MNLSERINAAYKTHTGSDKTRGARTWFARVLRVSNRTVTRWCDGSQTFDGPALSCLLILEKLAGQVGDYESMARGYDAETIVGRWERDAWLTLADALRISAEPKVPRTED